jgi:signal transduction histidine kinase
MAEDDPHREYLEVVIREAERLDRTLAEQSQLAAPEPPRLLMEQVNQVIQDALGEVAETLVRRRVRLLKKLAPDLPRLLLHGERIRRVMDNILADALEAVAPGGRIRIETRRSQNHVVVEVANDGVRPQGELLDQLFVPFSMGGPTAPVGLALAQQIVQEHGGEIRVRSEAEWCTIFAFTLPIRDNQDRRQSRDDRRSSRHDRRQRWPAA